MYFLYEQQRKEPRLLDRLIFVFCCFRSCLRLFPINSATSDLLIDKNVIEIL